MIRNPTAEREYGFKRRVKKGKGKHSWESHAKAGTLLKDVLHWLELLAANEPGRFVFITMPVLLQKCNARRIKNKLKPCSLSNLKHIFVFLHDMHIASPRFTTWDGRDGFIFEPHDARCSVEKGVCIKHTYTANQLAEMRKNWPSEKDAAEQLLRMAEQLLRMYGSTPRSTDAALDEHRCSTAVALPVAPLSAFRSTVGSTPRSTAEDVKPTDCAELTDEQVAKWMTENVQVGASKVCKVVGFEGLKEAKVTKEAPKSKSEEQQQERVSEVVSSGEPRTAEAKPKAKQPGRERDVLPPLEFSRAKTEDSLAEEKAEYEARPLCAKCGFKHYPDKPCIQMREPKRKP